MLSMSVYAVLADGKFMILLVALRHFLGHWPGGILPPFIQKEFYTEPNSFRMPLIPLTTAQKQRSADCFTRVRYQPHTCITEVILNIGQDPLCELSVLQK
jgi:hypothetical protein